MADIAETQQSELVRITDASETNIVKVSPEGELAVSNFANINFVDANKTASTTEILACAGVSNLANRKTLVIYNRGSQDIYYGTTGVDDTTGIIIAKDELVNFSVGENVEIYIVTKTGNSTVTIQEFSSDRDWETPVVPK